MCLGCEVIVFFVLCGFCGLSRCGWDVRTGLNLSGYYPAIIRILSGFYPDIVLTLYGIRTSLDCPNNCHCVYKHGCKIGGVLKHDRMPLATSDTGMPVDHHQGWARLFEMVWYCSGQTHPMKVRWPKCATLTIVCTRTMLKGVKTDTHV